MEPCCHAQVWEYPPRDDSAIYQSRSFTTVASAHALPVCMSWADIRTIACKYNLVHGCHIFCRPKPVPAPRQSRHSTPTPTDKGE